MNHLMTLCPAETKRFQRHQIKRFKYRCEAYPLVKQANLYNKERIFHLTDKLAFVRLEKKDISGFFLICLIIAHIICYAFLRLLLIIIDDPCLNIYMYLRNFFKDPFFFQHYAVIKFGRRWWNPIKPGVLYGRFEQPESIFANLVIWKELLLLTYVLYNGNRMIVISEMYWTVRYKFDSLITDKGTGKCKYFCIPYALFESSSELNVIRHALYVKP